VAEAGLLQVGQEGFAAMDDAPEVDAHEPLEVVVREARDRRVHVYSGVVEHEVHAPMFPRHGPGKPGLVDIADGHLGAGTGELERQRATHARCGTGHDCNSTLVVAHAHLRSAGNGRERSTLGRCGGVLPTNLR
jgi:hypothetical protein